MTSKKNKKGKKPRTNRVSAGSLTNKAGAGKAARKRLPTLTNAMVKAWGFECDDMVAAAVKYKGNLIDRLKRSKALRDEWARGRFLRTLGDLAMSVTPEANVAAELGIEPDKFTEFLDGDIEAADIWWRNKRQITIRLGSGVVAAACAGKAQALKSVERILNEGRSDPIGMNFRVKESQMMSITGVSRQTLHKWRTERLMPIEGDGTYDLRKVWQWFEGFSQRKVNTTQQVSSVDEMKDIKTLALKRDFEVELGKLLPRDEVIKGLVARLRQFLTLWDRLVDGVCDKCANLPKQGVREILDKFKDELRGGLCKGDIEMKLSESQDAELETFLKRLE